MKTSLLYVSIIVLSMSAGCADEGQEVKESVSTENLNRLAETTSPYLLQHASNPVDWYPWGEEALERARREGKPIFLSIGYSACHWCHVMERESFENEEIAAVLNEHFISIKVDREQRPDIDEIYMTAVQMMTGSGGWPLSVFLTPDLKPFFGGTYYPPEDRYGRPGFKSLLLKIAEAWESRQGELIDSAEELSKAIASAGNAEVPDSAKEGLKRELLSNAAAQFGYTFDSQWGGFGNAPKFPQTGVVSLLLREYARTGSADFLEAAEVSLKRMVCGGIYDQLGGGFHRYSVDRQWLVPHFEKMLYDNALISYVYLEAYQLTGEDLYSRAARETLDYVLRDMTDEAGGFHSAEDADSEGEEGKYYVWSESEIDEVLESDSALFKSYYDVTSRGNFEGVNILNVPVAFEDYASARGLDPEELRDNLEKSRAKLLNIRSRRVRPGLDDKVLVSWNGLMISSLTKGYQVLGDERYLKAAEKAGRFILTDMFRNGDLYHTFRKGKASHAGYLDDYASFSGACLDLYESTSDESWLDAAEKTASRMIELFGSEEGGFYFTSDDHKNLIARTRPFYDGSVPSGNSLAAMVLLRLGRMYDRDDFVKAAESILEAAYARISRHPMSIAYMLKALDFYAGGSVEYVIVTERSVEQADELVRLVHRSYSPNRVILYGSGKSRSGGLPLLKGRGAVDGLPTLYLCENNSCKKPMTDLTEIANILRFTKD